MTKFIYLLERQKYIWRNNDWVANQMSSAWSAAIYEEYTIARAHTRRDFEYMFSNEPDCIKFKKVAEVEELREEAVVGRITYTYRCCGEIYKVVYRITKKFLI